jgi:hypothetical protein
LLLLNLKRISFVFLIGYLGGASASACPTGYEINGTGCKASLPIQTAAPVLTSEYFWPPAPFDAYPVCGSNANSSRLPVSDDGQLSVYNTSTSGKPNILNGTTPLKTYIYATGADASPVYEYSSLTHCACIGGPRLAHAYPDTAPSPAGGLSILSALPSGLPRIYPDTADVLQTQTLSQSAKYGMIAIANDSRNDGRVGFNMFQTNQSSCGCPNLNEKPVLIATGNTNGPVGVSCVPMIAAHPFLVLPTFDPNYHDIATNSLVMDRVNEVKDQNPDPVLNGKLMQRVIVGQSVSNLYTTTTFNRSIWACAAPYELDLASGTCIYSSAHHACNGGGSGAVASPVSPLITGANPTDIFANALNKKLACCMNEYNAVTGSFIKFDCMDNSKTVYTSFDQLYESHDDGTDGGQSNALALSNQQGKPLTGFYTLNGTHCDQFSEFAGSIFQEKIDLNNAITKGVAIVAAQGADISNVQTYFAKSFRVPTSVNDFKACPILVRAAMVSACPATGTPPSVQTAMDTIWPNTAIPKRCSAASTIQVHLRIEQYVQIAGQAVMTPMDTILDQNGLTTISITDVLQNKYGNNCPPTTHALDPTSSTTVCVY